MTIVVVVPLVVYEPVFGDVTTHETDMKSQPEGMGVSLIVYVWKFVIFENTLVFAEVPLSIKEKFVSGDGDAVKEKEVEPFGVASLMMVIEPG